MHDEIEKDDRWLPCAEVARMVGISRQAVNRRIKRKTIPSMQEMDGFGGSGHRVVLVRPCDVAKKARPGRPTTARAGEDRKELEAGHRRRAHMYWHKRRLDKQRMDWMINGISAKIVEQERVKYEADLAETVEVCDDEQGQEDRDSCC